jgi:hypothetical protein
MRRIVIGAGVGLIALAASALAIAQISSGVPNAQPRAGSPPNIFANGYTATPLAVGSDPLENATGQYARYGYVSDNGAGSDAPTSGLDTKSEPDQNTYLITHKNPGGPTAGYDYGRHFLIQGHEIFGGASNNIDKAYLTRINLDVTDPAHRITLLNEPGPIVNGVQSTGIRSMDGSTYDPFTGDMLFTAEAGTFGGVISTPLQWDSTDFPGITRYKGSIGQGGYEGIQVDSHGLLYIAEDVGGNTITEGTTNTRVKQPNSFVYRYVPDDPRDLSDGKLQALQISVDDTPITFHTGAGARDDAFGSAIKTLHSGAALDAKWVTLHDTDVNGTAPFDSNALAKSKGATPLKRPENGRFVPDTGFASYVFDETGDTDNRGGTYVSPVDGAKASERGAWGAMLRLDMPRAGANDGKVRTIINGDAAHSSFDSVTFLDKDTLLVGEDRGDTLHTQLNALDSLWSFDLTKPLSQITGDAKRLQAQGRDPEATADVNKKEASPAIPDQNDGDNEVTGVLVSNGGSTIGGLLGRVDPAELPGRRIFFTQQHGENITYEITPSGP